MFRQLLNLEEERDEMEGVYEPRAPCCICTRPPTDPRTLPAEEARQRYTIIRKRTRPMDFIDDVFTFLGMTCDVLLNKIYRQ